MEADTEADPLPGSLEAEPSESELAAAAGLPDNYFELYKLAVEMADRVSARRSLANTFFLTVNTGLVTLMGTSEVLRWYIPVAGLLFAITWWALLKSYRDLNGAKFAVILGMEKQLPVRVYGDEDDRLRPGERVKFALRRATLKEWIAQYRELNRVERVVPIVFGAIYLAELLRQLLA